MNIKRWLVFGVIAMSALIGIGVFLKKDPQLQTSRVKVEYEWKNGEPLTKLPVANDPANAGYYIGAGQQVSFDADIPTRGTIRFISPVEGEKYICSWSAGIGKIVIQVSGRFFYRISPGTYTGPDGQPVEDDYFDTDRRYGTLTLYVLNTSF